MGTPVVREVVTGSAYSGTTSTVTINTGSGTAVGDWLVVFHAIDYAAASGDLPTPTGTAGTWTARTTATQTGANTTGAHVVVWTRAVTVGGAQSVTLGINGSDTGVHGHVYVLTNLAASPFVAAASSIGPASATAAVAPAVTANTGDLLLCAWQANYQGQQTAWTIPGSMSNATSSPVADQAIQTSAREVLAATGSTGTRTATQGTAANYSSATVAIAGAASTSVAAWVQPYTARRRAANF